MIIWNRLKACPAGFLAAGAAALAFGAAGCSLLESGATAESAPAAATSATEPEPLSKPLMTYEVKKGDSLWKLAKDYETTIQEIRVANNMQGDLIRAGDTILIPTDYADRQVSDEPGGGAVGSAVPQETVPRGVTPGVGTQPIQDAPATPPSQVEPPQDSATTRNTPPPITSEELRSANIRYFSNQPESGPQ